MRFKTADGASLELIRRARAGDLPSKDLRRLLYAEVVEDDVVTKAQLARDPTWPGAVHESGHLACDVLLDFELAEVGQSWITSAPPAGSSPTEHVATMTLSCLSGAVAQSVFCGGVGAGGAAKGLVSEYDDIHLSNSWRTSFDRDPTAKELRFAAGLLTRRFQGWLFRPTLYVALDLHQRTKEKAVSGVEAEALVIGHFGDLFQTAKEAMIIARDDFAAAIDGTSESRFEECSAAIDKCLRGGSINPFGRQQQDAGEFLRDGFRNYPRGGVQ